MDGMPKAIQSFWDEEYLFSSGDNYFKDLLRAIDCAQLSIEFETYIFEKGILAERFTAALSSAASRGVSVRLIVDGLGSPNFANDFWPRLKGAGVKVRFFRISPWILQHLPGDSDSIWQRFFNRWYTINRGNHRKFCLIDDQKLWVGSFNISDVHLKEVYGEDAWKDVGVRVQGREIKYAKRAFDRAYRGWKAFNLPLRSPRLILLNDSFIHKRRARIQTLRRLRRAKQRIWLATPYFVPVGPIYRRLARQAKRGLDVRLIVPEKSDVWFIKWLSEPLLQSLSKKGVKIYIYEPRFSHQKVFIADDWMCIGSTNLNHRSFLHDLEMDVVITFPENKAEIERQYLEDIKFSHAFDRSAWTRLSPAIRFISLIFTIFRYWS